MRFIEIFATGLAPEGMRCWSAAHGGYSWVISYDPGLPNWSDEERKRWQGYKASYRRLDQHTSKETIEVDDGPFPTFTAAEDACSRVWRGLKNSN